MTFAFDNHLARADALERLKALGVPKCFIVANYNLLIEGSVVVSRDQGAGQLPFICIAKPAAHFRGILMTLGI